MASNGVETTSVDLNPNDMTLTVLGCGETSSLREQ